MLPTESRQLEECWLLCKEYRVILQTVTPIVGLSFKNILIYLLNVPQGMQDLSSLAWMCRVITT